MTVPGPEFKLPDLAFPQPIPPRRLLLMAAFGVVLLLDATFAPLAAVLLVFAPFQRHASSTVAMILIGLVIGGTLFWLTRKTRRALS
jgi:hypothetical protein